MKRWLRINSQFFCTAALILLCGLFIRPAVAADDQPVKDAVSPRADISLNTGAEGAPGWRFIRKDAPDGAEENCDDSAWTAVDLPHTYNAKDGQDGGNNYYRGPTWYRRHFTVDNELSGRSFFLKFDGAATTAEVYVNGQLVGKHAGNFGAFCFDITSLVNTTNDNLLAVKVDNSRNPNTPPLAGDFNISGGLYRGVHLLALQNLSISPLDYASPGVYFKQTAVTLQQANVEVTVKLRNADTVAKTTSIACILLDAANHEVLRAGGNKNMPPQATADALLTLAIANPHLWNGTKDPYLYHVAVEIRDGETLTDRIVQPLGLRFFKVDPQQGFFLNGAHYDLHGVNRHQDRLDKGWAISDADHDEDFALIKEMGCTGIRLAHYEHAQHFYDLCDQGGMIVWAELCMVNTIGPTDEFKANARQQLTELIKQNYNHPSIVMWSLFNELRFGNEPATPGPHTWDFVGSLNTLARELDSTRLTTAASDRPADHPVNAFTDVIAFNRYFGWYNGKASDWPTELDKIHATLPTRSIGISEYGAGGSIFQHQIPPLQPKPTALWHPEEWECAVHETAWAAMHDRPWIWGTFLWNMFDFAVDSRNEGDTPGRNDKGMVTYDRKTKKDVFFFYQANWTTDPMVHINSRRFTPRPLADAPVKIYSNCPTVELKLNGTTLGPKSTPSHIFIWDQTTLKPGANTLEAIALTADNKTVKDTCTIVYDPNAPTSQPAP